MIPDSIEPVVGYRVWSALDSGYLASTNSRLRPWMPGVNEAVCYQTPAQVAQMQQMQTATSAGMVYHQNAPAQTVYKNVDGQVQEVPYVVHDLIPDPACGCGFWFLKSLEAVVGMFGPRIYGEPTDRLYRYGPHSPVVGRVKGWGKTVLAADGYRSEFAEVTAIIAAADMESFDRFQHIADLYGVPLEKSELLNPSKEAAPDYDLSATTISAGQIGSISATSLTKAKRRFW